MISVSTHKIKELGFNSRYFLAPINTGYANNGTPSNKLLKFHKQFLNKYLGVNYIGNIAIDKDAVTNPNTLYIKEQDLQKWIKLPSSLHGKYTKIGAQLAASISSITPQRNWVNSKIESYLNTAKEEFSSHNLNNILNIFDKFVSNANVLNSIGFNVVQIHAAHGYLLSKMINKNINRRTDIIGEKPYSMLLQLGKAIKESNPDLLLDIRVSMLNGINNKDKEIKETSDLLNMISNSYFDIISLSNGFYNIDKRYIYPPKNWGHTCFLNIVRRFANNFPNQIFNYSGNVWNINRLENIPDNLTFSIGRALLNDPKFIKKSYNNEWDESNYLNHNSNYHYYSKNKQNISCV